jgi:hypothetical protein
MCCCCGGGGGGGDGDGDGCKCRPLGWLLGLPFALLAVLVSIVGAIIWIIGYVLCTPHSCEKSSCKKPRTRFIFL